MGLLDMVGQAALPDAIALARAISDNAPLSIRGAKLLLESMAQGKLAENAGRIDAAMHAAGTSADYHEASRSFVEKRKPKFTGR